MKNILLAVALQRYRDFTPHALAARQVAMDLALFYKALIHAFTVEAKPLPLVPDADLETTEEKILRFIQPIKEAGIDVFHHILEGTPRKLITHHAREVQADLIVMGSHGKRTIMDVTLGGTAAAVLADAPCRVLLAAAPADQHSRIKELIVPDRFLDF
ncbi:universal stress protein [Nitrospinota bacterium]